MHFVISWDIKAEDEEWAQINTALRECFKGYSWVKPLTTFYIVRVDSQSDWTSILRELQAVAQQHTKEVRLVVSPLTSGGYYDGWLPKDLWPKIRERTQ